MRACSCYSVLLALVVAGCSSGDAGVHLSGDVSCDGVPIPFGEVLLTPDGSRGNSGQQGIAMIRNGRYDTAAAGAQGYAGGPTILRVTGFESPGGKLICEVELKADLPREKATHNIVVPKDLKPAPKKASEI